MWREGGMPYGCSAAQKYWCFLFLYKRKSIRENIVGKKKAFFSHLFIF